MSFIALLDYLSSENQRDVRAHQMVVYIAKRLIQQLKSTFTKFLNWYQTVLKFARHQAKDFRRRNF